MLFLILMPHCVSISDIISLCIAFARTRVNRVDRDLRRVLWFGIFSRRRVAHSAVLGSFWARWDATSAEHDRSATKRARKLRHITPKEAIETFLGTGI
jgi:hypothetical protein